MLPLHVAATNGRYKIVEHLVGQDVTDARDNSEVSTCAFDIRLIPLIALYISSHPGENGVFNYDIRYLFILPLESRVCHNR